MIGGSLRYLRRPGRGGCGRRRSRARSTRWSRAAERGRRLDRGGPGARPWSARSSAGPGSAPGRPLGLAQAPARRAAVRAPRPAQSAPVQGLDRVRPLGRRSLVLSRSPWTHSRGRGLGRGEIRSSSSFRRARPQRRRSPRRARSPSKASAVSHPGSGSTGSRSHSVVPPRCALGAVADREAVGKQDLVGGGSQVGAQVTGGRVLEDRPRQLLELGGGLGGRRRPRRPRGGSPLHSSRSSADRPVDDRLDLGATLGLGAERGDPHRQPEVGGPAAFEQEAQREQVVVERLDDDVALEPGLEAVDRSAQRRRKAGPARGAAAERRCRAGERAREGREVAELGLGQPVAARALAPGAGRDPAPAVAGRARPGVRAEPDAARP